MGKLPALQFYPGDWRKDVGVQSLTFNDRGIWFEMLMLMHESDIRGLLVLNGRPMPIESLSRLLGLDIQILNQTLTNLLTYGVASVEPDTGALMCRRMVRDEKIRKVRTEAGQKGGNPALLNQNTTTQVKQIPTPSSSPSTTATGKEQKTSRAKAASDSRHTPFREALEAYWQYANKVTTRLPWEARDGKCLSQLLAASPDLTLEQFRRLLHFRAKSAVAHGDRVYAWIGKVHSYTQPLNEYNRPEVSDGKAVGNSGAAVERVKRTGSAWDAATDKRVARSFGNAVEADVGGLPSPGILRGDGGSVPDELRGSGAEVRVEESRMGAKGLFNQAEILSPPSRSGRGA